MAERKRVVFTVEVVATVDVVDDDQALDEISRELCAATREAVDDRLRAVTCVGDWDWCE